MPVFDPGVPWLRGTATLTNGSTTVETDGVITLNEILEGDRLYVVDGGERIGPLEIVGGEGDGLELRDAFEGATGSYSIAIDRNPITPIGAKILRDVAQAMASMSDYEYNREDVEQARDEAQTARDQAVAAAEATEGLEDKADEAIAAAGSAVTAADQAESARSAAEAARDAAQLSAAIYDDTDAGLAATTDGDYFSVPSPDDDEYLILYRNDSGSATEVRRYPSTTGVQTAVGAVDARVDAVEGVVADTADAATSAVDLASAPGQLPAEFPDAQPFAFGFTDGDGNVLAGIDGEGNWRTRVRAEFPDEEDLAWARTDEQGHLLYGVKHNGDFVARGINDKSTGTALAAYLDGTALYGVGAREEMLADLGSYAVEALAPGNAKSVRAVIGRPMIGGRRSVSVGSSGLLIPDSDKVLHIVIGLGQSLMVGAQSADSLVHTEPVYPDMALMPDIGAASDVRLGLEGSGGTPQVFDPGSFTGFRPLVARVGQTPTQGETVMEQFANALAREARNLGIVHRTLLFTSAYGGTDYEGLKKGTQVYANMIAALTRAKGLAEAQGWQVVVDACVVRHGEADAGDAGYDLELLEWQQDINTDVQAITGQQAPVHFLIAQPSSFYGTDTQAVQRMVEVCDSSPYHHLAGPDYGYADLYAADILHGTGPFYVLSGEYLARAFRQVIWTAEEHSAVTRIVSAERSGTTVTLTYEVPAPPLVIDTATVSERDVRGFRYTGGGGAAITAVTLTGPNTIELTLASEPSGEGEVVHYALRGHSGSRDVATIPRGNVRDSADARSAWENRPLYNWAVHQRVPVTVN